MAVERNPQDWEEPQDRRHGTGAWPEAAEGDEQSQEPEPHRPEPAFRREPRPQPGPRYEYHPEPAPQRPALLSPSSIVALLLGMGYVGFGAVALSRGGFEELNLHHTVIGIAHTPLLGLMEIVYGALLLVAAALNPPWGRNLAGALGIVAIGFGLLVLFFQPALLPALGVTMVNGWLYIATGAAVLLAALASATFVDRRRGVVYDR